MNLQESAVATAGRLASESVAAQDFVRRAGGNCGRVGPAGAFDAGVAFGAPERPPSDISSSPRLVWTVDFPHSGHR